MLEVQSAVVSFRVVNDRVVELRFRVPMGMFFCLSVCAPHSDDLTKFENISLTNYFLVGNLQIRIVVSWFYYTNAKLDHQLPGEEDVLGDYVFDSPFSRA